MFKKFSRNLNHNNFGSLENMVSFLPTLNFLNGIHTFLEMIFHTFKITMFSHQLFYSSIKDPHVFKKL